MARNPECQLCPLHQKARHICLWGEGPIGAPLMLIGEAPGREEDIAGLPFMGKAGKLLDYCLKRLQIPRKTIYITNVLKCRPPNNELPGKKADRIALEICEETYLQQEIQDVKPKAIVTLGATALGMLTGTYDLASWQGRRVNLNKEGKTVKVPVFAAYHPAYILRNPWEERKLVVALARAALHAGLPASILLTNELFSYDEVDFQ